MKFVTAANWTRRWIGGVVFVLALGWASQAQAQLAAGTWARTDAQARGMTMTAEACCKGGLRLTYHLPAIGKQPPVTLTIDSPMTGAEVPALTGGKPSGQTMAIKRVDDRHYSAVVKMKGALYVTANGTVSADGKKLTVEDVTQVGGKDVKTIETWVLK